MMLCKLMKGAQNDFIRHSVISLTDLGPLVDKLIALGVSVEAIGMRRGIPSPVGCLTLVRRLARLRPTIVQTWLYHSDLLGGIAARLARCHLVAWNVRGSNLDRRVKRLSRMTAWTCARLSAVIPTAILCCSRAAARLHVSMGYVESKMVVIPNGFDLEEFKPNPAERSRFRTELGVAKDRVLIGIAARLDPQKDYPNFFLAARLLASKCHNVEFLLCGDDVVPDHPFFARELAGLDRHRFHLLGRRRDMPRIMTSLDIGTLSSAYGEAFPNAIGEAMASEVPCVATDVGETADIIGETGKVVPPADPAALAHAWEDLVIAGPEARKTFGRAARERVMSRYQIADIVHLYEDFYQHLAATPRLSFAESSGQRATR